MTRIGVVDIVVAVALAGAGGAGCGVVALRATPGPPDAVAYVGPHGRPRAYGGGVCPLGERHQHPWPPTPAAAFVLDDGAWRDTRTIASFPGPHALGRGHCATSRWHQHALASPPTTATR
ncbi:MAG: hypothetical protein FJ137_07790 [Deltaproteobacteria bacterium]|nr:hypothetical protein [Deltaproteobacteria bacterium]